MGGWEDGWEGGWVGGGGCTGGNSREKLITRRFMGCQGEVGT